MARLSDITLPRGIELLLAAALLVSGVIMAGKPLYFLNIGWHAAVDDRHLEATGRVAEKITKSECRGKDNSRCRDVLALKIRFRDADGNSFETEKTVSAQIWGSVDEGAPVSVVYLRDNPEQNRLQTAASGQSPSATSKKPSRLPGYLGLVLAATVMAAGLWLLQTGLNPGAVQQGDDTPPRHPLA